MPNKIAPAPAAAPATPEPSPIQAPGGASIPTVNANDKKPSAVVAKLTEPDRREPKVRGPREALGIDRRDDPDANIRKQRAEQKTKERDAATGQFVKQPKAKAKPKTEKPPIEAVRPQPPTFEPTPPAPAAAPEPAPQPPVSKIKIGDREMTPEEVAEHVAKLEAAATAKAAAPEPPATPEPAKPTAEELSAQEAQKDTDFIAQHAPGYTPTQEQMDAMLASGDGKLLGEFIARAVLDARKLIASAVNPMFKQLEDRMAPALSQSEQVAQYQAETDFLAIPEHKDIAAHPEAKQAIRQAGALLHQHYDQLQRLIAGKVATPEEIKFAAALENREQWNADIAYHARRILAQSKPAAATPAPAPAIAPAPTPRPAPPNGQPNGGTASAPSMSTAAAVRARIAHTRY